MKRFKPLKVLLLSHTDPTNIEFCILSHERIIFENLDFDHLRKVGPKIKFSSNLSRSKTVSEYRRIVLSLSILVDTFLLSCTDPLNMITDVKLCSFRENLDFLLTQISWTKINLFHMKRFKTLNASKIIFIVAKHVKNFC